MAEAPSAIRVRRTAGTIRSACAPSRFRNGARDPAGLLSEEDGALEARGITRHPDSSRGQHPGWFILHEESGRLERRGVTRALVSSEARSLTGSLSVPSRGFEPRSPSLWTMCLYQLD